MRPTAHPGAPGTITAVRAVRPRMLALFRRLIAQPRLRRQFSAVRLAFAHRLPPAAADHALIFYLNHPSWWDPLVSMVLAERFIPGRHFYAPIDAAALRQNGILRNFGLFPVELDTPRGALQFLRAAEAVLARGDVLGLTPQGAFTDPRVRPPTLKPGLGKLLSRLDRVRHPATIVPIALEYPFWNDRLPEALAAVGEPLHLPRDPALSAVAWTHLLEQRLAAALDELAALALARDAAPFETLLQGVSGAAGFYGFWQRLRAGRFPSPGTDQHGVI